MKTGQSQMLFRSQDKSQWSEVKQHRSTLVSVLYNTNFSQARTGCVSVCARHVNTVRMALTQRVRVYMTDTVRVYREYSGALDRCVGDDCCLGHRDRPPVVCLQRARTPIATHNAPDATHPMQCAMDNFTLRCRRSCRAAGVAVTQMQPARCKQTNKVSTKSCTQHTDAARTYRAGVCGHGKGGGGRPARVRCVVRPVGPPSHPWL